MWEVVEERDVVNLGPCSTWYILSSSIPILPAINDSPPFSPNPPPPSPSPYPSSHKKGFIIEYL